MRATSIASVIAAVAVTAATVTPSLEAGPPADAPHVRLAAAAAPPPLGAIPAAFIGNQFLYCSLICPFAVQAAVTVPLGAALSPVQFVGTLASTGSLGKALGAAAASVTGPANAALTPLFDNDVFRVVPRAFNSLEVAAVEAVNVASAVLRPADLLPSIDTARTHILAALNQPLPPPAPTETGARTLPQVLAVETIRVVTAIAFQAGELLLLGVVQTADAAAQKLAETGDFGAALSAGAAQAVTTLDTAGGIVRDAVGTAVTNVGRALADPFPSAAATDTVRSQQTHSTRAVPPRVTEPTAPREAEAAAPQHDRDAVTHRNTTKTGDKPTATKDHSGSDSAAPDSSATDSRVSTKSSRRDFSRPDRSSAAESSTPKSSGRDNATPRARKNTTNSGPPR